MWIYRYLKTKYEGVTFMLPFLGARAYVWRDMLEYPGSLKGMVDNYKKLIPLKDT